MIHVIGLGLCPDHLGSLQRALIADADIVGGGRRQLEAMHIAPEKRLVLDCPVEQFAQRLCAAKNHAESLCVLADGDPLLFGLGASLLRYVPPSAVTLHPNISALQTAAARFGLPWHEARILSLHGRNNLPALFAALTHARLIGVYTDQTHSPDALASALLDRGVRGWRMHVAEALCTPEEQCVSCTPEQAAERTWHALNIVLFERETKPRLPLRLGLNDAELSRENELLTKQPVRALALSCLGLSENGQLWDLGAGSGAVSLEAAALMPQGRVLAVERQPHRIARIRENIVRTGAWLVEPVCASIEDFLQTLSPSSGPQHIFIGGGATNASLNRCCDLLCPGGRMVVSAVLFSTLETTRAVLQSRHWPCTIHQLMHHASAPLGPDLRLIPSNPVFLIETQKPQS